MLFCRHAAVQHSYNGINVCLGQSAVLQCADVVACNLSDDGGPLAVILCEHGWPLEVLLFFVKSGVAAKSAENFWHGWG